MNGPEVLQVVLFRQDENHGVVPVTTARMHLRTERTGRTDRFTFAFPRSPLKSRSATGKRSNSTERIVQIPEKEIRVYWRR